MSTNQNPIKGVACSFKGNMYYLPAPYRHSDVIRTIKLMHPGFNGPYIGVQGFYDANGHFLTREEGFEMVIGTKHYITPTPHSAGVLFSEDVWETPGAWGAEPETDEYKAFHDVYNEEARLKKCKVVSFSDSMPNGYPLALVSKDAYETSGIYIHMTYISEEVKIPSLYSEHYKRIEHHPECTESEKIIAVAKTVKAFLHKYNLLDKIELGLTEYEHKASNINTDQHPQASGQ